MNTPCRACGQVHHLRAPQEDKSESVVSAIFVGFLIVAAFWLGMAWLVTL
jgi:hypothetical protein